MMKNFVNDLEKIAFRKGNRTLTFGIAHILKSMQLMRSQKYVSRTSLCKELCLGEGSIKTIILRLKKTEHANSIKAETFLLEQGHDFMDKISEFISKEVSITSKFFPSQHNHAILLKNFEIYVDDGMKQRDYAIKSGASSAMTIIFNSNQFLITTKDTPCLIDDKETQTLFQNTFKPTNGM